MYIYKLAGVMGCVRLYVSTKWLRDGSSPESLIAVLRVMGLVIESYCPKDCFECAHTALMVNSQTEGSGFRVEGLGCEIDGLAFGHRHGDLYFVGSHPARVLTEQ